MSDYVVKLPKIEIKKDILQDINRSKKLEWIITNGLGGYASSTVIGMNTRKYHGLLIASKKPPMDRKVLLSKLEEKVRFDGKKFELSTNRYSDVIHPLGYKFLKQFVLEGFPSFIYDIDGITIKKTIAMPNKKNIVIVVYEVDPKNKKNIDMRIRPLINFRSIYSLTKTTIKFSEKNHDHGFRINFNNDEFMDLYCEFGCYIPNRLKEEKKWYYNFFYENDYERGENATENCYNPGMFEFKINGKKRFDIVISYCDKNRYETEKLIEQELKRKISLLKNSKLAQKNWMKWLVLAGDMHIIKRFDKKTSIIAGYHWFSEWGRDSLISMKGICLVTGRFKEAREIIETLLQHSKNGLIPNAFPVGIEGEPIYNSVDANLWLINSVYSYFSHTHDIEFVRKIWKKMKRIVEVYMNGVDNIKMDEDCLIKHGPGLTWMDAKVDGNFVTPRGGKAVEIQALWYNALRIMEFFAEILKDRDKNMYSSVANIAKKNFLKKFWNGKYLNDTINDRTIRPNQIIALDLPFRVLTHNQECKVLNIVEKKLLTEYGIRTLPKENPNFHRRYVGNLKERDEAYHQGTIWPWLLGPFVRSHIRIRKDNNILQKLVKPFVEREIKRFGLGTISEIIDGDASFESRGCISQAWSISEILNCLS